MSVIRKKPFIESVIESLTDEQKASLLSVMNGSENTVNASFTDLPEADVAPVLFQLEPNNLKTGILIQGSTYNVLLAYHRFQDMQIYNLDLSKFTFEKINEYLDINELRRTVSGGSVNPENIVNIVNTAIEDGDITAGTEVIANPTLAGTESSLTGLQVGDTKYSVGGGTKLYRHYFEKSITSISGYTLSSGAMYIYGEVITKQQTAFGSFNNMISHIKGSYSSPVTIPVMFINSYTITKTSNSHPCIATSSYIADTMSGQIRVYLFDLEDKTIEMKYFSVGDFTLERIMELN